MCSQGWYYYYYYYYYYDYTSCAGALSTWNTHNAVSTDPLLLFIHGELVHQHPLFDAEMLAVCPVYALVNLECPDGRIDDKPDFFI
jgi:hypothetical protein